jgi:hypothetical protein
VKHVIVASILTSVSLIIVSTGAGAGDARSLNAARNQLGAFHAVGPLDASQLQAIQTVSRSVLSAKRGQVSDSEQIALRDEVKALSVSIDQALAPQATSVRLLDNESSKQVSRATARDEDRFATVRSRLSSLRERNRQTTGHRREGHVDAVRTEDLVVKAGKLDEEVQAALAAPPPERLTKLRELRSRLQIKGQNELMMERRAEADARRKKEGGKGRSAALPETPTISTIDKHR